MTRSLMFLSTLMLAACGAASIPTATTTPTPVPVAAYTPYEVDCDADQIRTLWCLSGANFREHPVDPSMEALRQFRDAAVLNAEQPGHPMTCHMLFAVQNFQELETMDLLEVMVPTDVHDDLARIEPTLVSACPGLAERADREARDELVAYRADGDISHLYTLNPELIRRHVATATACDAVEATRTAINTPTEEHPTAPRQLSRWLPALQQLCDSARTPPTPT